MKKFIVLMVILSLLLTVTLSTNAVDSQTSDYDLYYPQFVDTTVPLSEIQLQDFVINRNAAYASKIVLSQMPDENRTDYFDIAYGTDPLQKLDIHHLKGNKKRPVVIFIHGGGWSFGDKDHSRFIAPKLVSLGYTVVSINYRLGPQNPHPAQIEDCAKALKWVIDNIHNYGGNPNRIAVTGHSAGGHLAALLVTGTKWQEMYGIDMKKVKCWIPMSGVHDFNLKENYYQSLMPGFIKCLIDDPSKRDDTSPVNHVTGNEPPSLIVHGGDDWLVPRTNSIKLYNLLKEKGTDTKLEIVKGYWHSNVLLNFGEPGHVPTTIVSKYLAQYLPTSENNLGDYNENADLKVAN